MGMYILTITVLKYILVVKEHLGIEVSFEVLIIQKPRKYLHLNKKAKYLQVKCWSCYSTWGYQRYTQSEPVPGKIMR